MFMQDQATFTNDRNAEIFTRFPRNLCDGVHGKTLIETDGGWQQAEWLKAGDRVQTYDGGLREISRVERRFFDQPAQADAPAFLVSIPGGVLDTCSDVVVMPEQRILIEDPVLEGLIGAPSALVRAGDLAGLSGIALRRVIPGDQIVRPILEDEELLWANTGLMCHFGETTVAGTPEPSPFFQALGRTQARLALFEMTRPGAVIRSLRAA